MKAVVDASVAIKWYTAENHHEEAEFLLGNAIELHAPELIVPEFGNIVWKKSRAGLLPGEKAEEIIDLFLGTGIFLYRQSDLLAAAFRSAIELNKSVYDCTYLALSKLLSLPFVTADDKFYNDVTRTDSAEFVLHIRDIESLNSR
ncbi:MAG: type II toxin-antitoxin system VapC family toxin [Pyrinomonadaceae bacterium]